MPALYDDAFVEQLRLGLGTIAHEWALSPDASITTLNVSENATFLAIDPGTLRRIVLRVYRTGYHERDEIESELAWIRALRRDAVVATPKPVRCESGDVIATMRVAGVERRVVAFEFMSGSEPTPQDRGIVPAFRQLGAISARLHAHARRWQRPPAFRRKVWRYETMLGSSPLWGDWRDAVGLTPDGTAVIERACGKLEHSLAHYGEQPGRFGLVHADLRLTNLLVERDRLGVIDFDDCGFSWYLYDFAAAVSFFEDHAIVPELQDAWVEGYREVAPLPADEVAVLPTFIMLRRILLTAWLASHAETPTAKALGAQYIDGTVAMAENYLANCAQNKGPAHSRAGP
jgi:Ser/Thr protein kinase RdoA (MazF antagonist)